VSVLPMGSRSLARPPIDSPASIHSLIRRRQGRYVTNNLSRRYSVSASTCVGLAVVRLKSYSHADKRKRGSAEVRANSDPNARFDCVCPDSQEMRL